MKQHLTLILITLMAATIVQAKVITGHVTDPTGETIISASVVVKGTTIGTVTDMDGYYQIEVPDDAKTLVFSYLGMLTQEHTIVSDVIDVVMKEDAKVLDEIVVTGYGTTKKRDLVTAVSSVGGDQLKDIPVVTAAEALQGKLAGVQVITTEGSPEAEVKIRVRGGTSLTQSNEPLYIVDGFPVSSIADIAPGDIQSIDVLKDAAATAIYGAKGANGVIMITTKETKLNPDDKSKKLKVHADYSGYMGWRTIAHKHKMMSGEDYLRMQYEFLYLSEKGDSTKMTDRFFKPYSTYNPSQGRYERTDNIAGWDMQTYSGGLRVGDLQNLVDFWSDKGTVDWQDEIYGGNHLNSNHTFAFGIGNKMFSLDLSYNRVDDKSIMYGSNFDRNTLALKLKVQPIKGLSIGLSGRYVNTNVLGSGTNSLDEAKNSKSDNRFRNAVAFLPLYGVPVKVTDNESYDETDANTWNIYNPFSSIDDSYKTKVEHKWSVNGYIAYKFLNHFTVRAEAGYEGRAIKQKRFYGQTTGYAKNGDGKSQAVAADGSPLAHVIATDTKSTKFKETNTFEYAQKFRGGRHDLTILVGEEQIINKNELDYTYAFGFDPIISPKTTFKNLDTAIKTIYDHYVSPNDNMLSVFARANYVLFGRYYFTATFRADASTKFARGHQWGFFPSGAIAWRMSDEPWMRPAQDVLSNLKWRISYGAVGNNNIDLGYLYVNYIADYTHNYMQGMSSVLVDGRAGSNAELIAPNDKLKWETTITRDLGLDFGFWNERLSGSVDLYWNTTKDLLLKYKLATGGYNYQFRNIGSTENKGVEFSVRGVILDCRSKKLNYMLTLDANIAYNHNRVVDLGGMDDYRISTECFSTYYKQPYEFKLSPGSAIGDVYGFETDGFYTTADFNSLDKGVWKKDGKAVSAYIGDAYPGMTRLKDQNGDGKIDESDMVKLGNTMPIVSGGFNLGFQIGGEKWGMVDLAANFSYSIGNDIVNMTALDLSTITSSSKNRNLLASFAYGQRYSIFDTNGNVYGLPSGTTSASGAAYNAMAAAIESANAGLSVANPYSKNIVLTDKYVEDGSFLRMTSLNVGYSLPDRWISKAHITKARIFFSASNLFVITKYSGADPEVDTRSGINPLAVGVDYAAFPKSRSYNFGINLSF